MSAPPGQGCSWRSRSTSSSVRMPRAESGSLGTPIRVARGSGRRAPRDHTDAAVVAGATRSSAAPTRVTRSTASGRRASTDSAPTSTRCPATCSRRSLPPRRSLPSSTVTAAVGSASSTSSAAVRPATPPPTTTTWGRVDAAGTDMPSSLSRATEPSTRPGARHRCRRRVDGRGPACVHAGPRWSRPVRLLAATPWSWARPPPPALQDSSGPAGAGSLSRTGHRHARARRSRPASSTSTRARPGRWRRC